MQIGLHRQCVYAAILIIVAFLPDICCAKIVINEVMWAGSDVSTADEWLEFFASEDTDVSGWTVTAVDSKGAEVTMFQFPSHTIIQSGSYVLLSNFDAAHSRLSTEPAFVTTKVSLLNSNFLVRLRNASGAIIDEVDDGSGAPFAGSTTPKASMERVSIDLAGNDSANWVTAETSRNFDTGQSIFGTPGIKNETVKKIAEVTVTVSSKKCSPRFGTGVIISEILPSPSGDDEEEEWIEIHNVTLKRISLCGWTLDDSEKGSRPFPLDDFEIDPLARLVLKRPQTKIALNNDHDAVRLIDPSNTIVNQVSYHQVEENKAYSIRGDGLYLWTKTLTPGSENIFPNSDRQFAIDSIRVSAVLPNPEGPDADSEFVELRNTITEPMLLNGWKLKNHTGKIWTIEHLRLRPHESAKISADLLPWSLPNDGGSISLLDPEGYLVSMLEWNEVSDGEIIVAKENERIVATLVAVNHDSLVVAIEKRPEVMKRMTVYPAGISYEYFSDLNEVIPLEVNKNIELQFDTQFETAHCHGEETLSVAKGRLEPCSGLLTMTNSKSRHAYITLFSGESLQHLLLRSGDAIVDTSTNFLSKKEFLAYEQEARDAKLGYWSDDAFTDHIVAMREEESLQRKIDEEGLQLVMDSSSTLLKQGSGITLTTNIPADIFVSVNGKPLHLLSGALVMKGDAMRVHAFAQIRSGSSALLRSKYLTNLYVAEKERYSEDVVISEIYPAPPPSNPKGHRGGTNEWIELFNPSNRPIYLAGWSIDDAVNSGSKPWKIPSNVVVPPKGFVTFFSDQTKLALNNDGDDVRLIAPNGRENSVVTYGKLKKGQSYVTQNTYNTKQKTNMPSPLVGEGQGEGVGCVSDVPTPAAESLCIAFEPEKTALDSDHDFLPDDREIYLYHTDPHNPDSDADGWLDGFEVSIGRNPLRKDSDSREITLAYRDFVAKHFKPKMYAYKTKGLTLKAKTYPIDSINLLVELSETKLLTRRNDDAYEAVVTQSLPAGPHSFAVQLRDILGREVLLANIFSIDLPTAYAFRPSSAKTRGGIDAAITEESNSSQSALLNSLLHRGRERQPAPLFDSGDLTVIGIIAVFWMTVGAILLLWLKR